MSQRIAEHPILGKPEKGELVEILLRWQAAERV